MALVTAGFLVVVGLGAAGCTSADANRPSSAATSATAPSGDATTQTPSDDTGDGSTSTPAPALPNTIAAAPAKVLRDGQPSTPTVTADSQGFASTVRYSDNTTVAVLKATKQVESGNGPGVFAGREYVKLEVQLTNGSSQPIDLNSVVITTYYGGTNQIAAPVYTPSADTADFTGTLAPGASSVATYGFAVPVSELGNVTMVVDFDGQHSSATFTGAVNLS